MDGERTPLEALKAAIECYGSQSEAARRRCVTQSAVSKWLHDSKRCPPEHVLGIEADTGVSRHELRPDIYPFNMPSAEEVLARHARTVACDRAEISHRGAA